MCGPGLLSTGYKASGFHFRGNVNSALICSFLWQLLCVFFLPATSLVDLRDRHTSILPCACLRNNRGLKAVKDCVKLCLGPSKDFAANLEGRAGKVLRLLCIPPASPSQHLSPWVNPPDPSGAQTAHDPQAMPGIRCESLFSWQLMGIAGMGSERADRKESSGVGVGGKERRNWWKATVDASERNPPISSRSLETFHLVKTEIWFQGSKGNLWLSKKRKKEKGDEVTFP